MRNLYFTYQTASKTHLYYAQSEDKTQTLKLDSEQIKTVLNKLDTLAVESIEVNDNNLIIRFNSDVSLIVDHIYLNITDAQYKDYINNLKLKIEEYLSKPDIKAIMNIKNKTINRSKCQELGELSTESNPYMDKVISQEPRLLDILKSRLAYIKQKLTSQEDMSNKR